MQKLRKFWNFTIGCRMSQHKQKSKFDQDSSSKNAVVYNWLQEKWFIKMKSEENFETLQLAAEYHSMNKNQSLIKIRPVVPEKNAKKWENFETLQLAAECHSINKNQSLIKIRPVVPEKNAKKWRKFGNIVSGCRVSQHKQKSKFDQDESSSSREKCQKLRKFVKLCTWLQNATAWTKIKVWWRPVVLQKNAKKWKNFETLQLAAEWHSMNKNQRFIKMKPVVPKNNAKNWETLQTGCRVPQHEQKSKFDQDQTSSSWEKCKKWRKFWNFTIGCRMPQHEQKSKFDQDQTSSSWEKCKKVRKFWNFTIGCRVPQHKQKSKIWSRSDQ